LKKVELHILIESEKLKPGFLTGILSVVVTRCAFSKKKRSSLILDLMFCP